MVGRRSSIRKRRRQRFGALGYTLIELIIIIVVLGILLALALPRYLSYRRNAIIAEADEVLNELRILAWGYYLRESTWVGLTSLNLTSILGFTPPDDADGCWDYGLVVDGTATQIQLRATGDSTPVKCVPASGSTVTLTLTTDGLATRVVTSP